MKQCIEIQFPVLGDSLAVNHGYALYGALARKVPSLHAGDTPVGIASINGTFLGQGTLKLHRQSRLCMRLPADAIVTVLPLAGQRLDLDGTNIRLGVPNVRAITSASSLAARLVTIKIVGNRTPTPEQFLEAVHRRLAENKIQGEASLPRHRGGPHTGTPLRRILWLKGRALTGFALRIDGLSQEDSLHLQADSPFSRRRMGCGFFVPVEPEEVVDGI